ncbi:patatin-like phospholipase [Pseudoduganella lurida]|uniref:Patatin-like phospholipase n=1 Tax=Pseudoduganella lurida TaxID=1036180 RepID=A0A562RG64_9BURK|nr:patatin-like phospholipase family protein [Pseudoduganella lurida]TWI67564.1 patatin-like phospholipase [Pseudoduganella lurida]
MSAVPESLHELPLQDRPQSLLPEPAPRGSIPPLHEADVLALERTHLEARRRHDNVDPDLPAAGLALSGGGIRSATFGLGVLEGLRDLRILPRFDYASSVSGGGYIMAWLTAHVHRHGAGWLNDGSDNAARWDASIAHLSRFSNYLSPRVGLFSADTWTMFTVWARNAALVQMTIIAYVLAALLLPRLAVSWFESWPAAGWARWLVVVLFMAAILGIVANQLHQRPGARQNAPHGIRPWPAWSAGAVAALALAAWLAVRFDFHPFGAPKPQWVALPFAALLLGGMAALLPAAAQWRFNRVGRTWPDSGQGHVQWLIVLPLLATSVELSAVLWYIAKGTPPRTFGAMFQQGLPAWPFQLSLAFAALCLLACCSLRDWTTRTRLWSVPRPVFNLFLIVLSAGTCIVALHAMFAGIVVLMQWFGADGRSRAGVWHAFIWGPSLLLSAFAMAVTLLLGLLGRASLEGMREWWSRLAAWLWIYALGWNLITLASLYGPLLLPWLLQFDGWAGMAPAAGWIATTVAGLFAANSGATSGDNKIRSSERGWQQLGLEVLARVAPVLFILGLLVATATVLNLALWHVALPAPALSPLCNVGGCWSAYVEQYWDQVHHVPPGLLGLALAGVVLAGVLLAWRVDINEFSLHAFYRSRLARCYLGASRTIRTPQRFTQFDDDDDLPVGSLGGQAEAGGEQHDLAPLHLINCTVNLGGSKDLSLHTRHGASFTITPYTVGSSYPKANAEKIGYRPHDYYAGGGGDVPGISLGEAIAVSGAAASPNHGFHTSPSVAFMMTMFNARLGRWFANPRQDNTYPSPWFSLRYLVKELFGSADERANYLMISDGGHFENLAAYELVRRKCRLIVVSDAECDTRMDFGGLGTLIRLCKVDFNVRIEIDVAPLRLDPATGLSRAHCAIGSIDYGDGVPGVLVYLKASLTEAVRDASLWQYQATHRAFPQESTGDQFYGEDQFESYRRLGRHIVKQAFGAGMDQPQRDRLARVRPDFSAALSAAGT